MYVNLRKKFLLRTKTKEQIKSIPRETQKSAEKLLYTLLANNTVLEKVANNFYVINFSVDGATKTKFVERTTRNISRIFILS